MSSENVMTKNDQGVSVFKVVPPQDGGWSLMPMENLLRGLRNADDMISLELFGVNGVINYGVRTTHSGSLNGMFNAYFPLAQISSHKMGRVPGEIGEEDRGDWLALDEDEHAVVQTLGLARESYLPLRIFEDRIIQQAQMDPLAGVIGVISSNTTQAGTGSGDRLGIRLVIRPAPENWNAPWQNFMQARRDGDDRTPRPGGPGGPSSSQSGPSLSTIASLGGLAAVGIGNYFLWNSGDAPNVPGMILFNAVAVAAGILGYWLAGKFRGGKKRPYLDEPLVEEKLKSLAFWSELQIVRIYRNEGDEFLARDGLEQVVDCIRSFDDPAGNSWNPGQIHRYSGMSVARREYRHSKLVGNNRILGWLTGQDRDLHPFVGGSQILGWLDAKRAEHTILSAREVSTVWHLPLGMNEMASMERVASGALIPFLGDLSSGSEDSGPLVGMAGDREIRFPESSMEKHVLVLGRSGTGKSTFIKHIINHKLRRKAEGKDDGAVVVIDPHADLVREILQLVPVEIAHKVRLLDFGRQDRVPGLNLVDPNLFTDRDRCVDTIISTVRHLWETWGGRLEDILKNSLMIVYEFNCHAKTSPNEMLTMLDILLLLQDGVVSGRGREQTTEMSAFQRHCLSRVSDPRLKQWFNMYLAWPRDTRAEAVGPVFSRIGAYAAHRRASVIMGQRETTIMLSDVLSEGLVLLVSTAQGTVGKGPAALMGGTIVSLVESALRDQESLPPDQRAKCLLICDEFQTVTGADWEGLFAEIRKYGCSMMLATQSISRLDTSERKLKAGILGNVGVIVGYQMSAEDAHIISSEMDSDRVTENLLVNLYPHHCCVRINSSTICYPAFSMKTLPPPDLTHGSQEAVDRVLEESLAYTTDWQEAWDSLSLEMEQQLVDGGPKIGAGTMPGPDGGTDGDSRSGSTYDRQVDQEAAGRLAPNPHQSPASNLDIEADSSTKADPDLGPDLGLSPGLGSGGPPPPRRSRDDARPAEREFSVPPADVMAEFVEERVAEPVLEPVSESISKQVAEPAVELVSEAVAEASFGPAAESGPALESVLETVLEGDPAPDDVAGVAVVAGAVPTVPSGGRGRRGKRQNPRPVPESARQASRLDGGVIDYINDPNTRDEGLRVAMDNRLGEQVSRAFKQANKAAEKKAEELAKELADQRMEPELEKARQEAYLQGLREARGEVVEEELGDGKGPRRLGILRRAGTGK